MQGSQLRLYQREVFDAIFDRLPNERAATYTVLLPRQAGKNQVSAAIVASLLYDHPRGGSVIVCAPTLIPQAMISLTRTSQALRSMLTPSARRNARVEGNVVRFQDARAIFLSASPEAHVAGHTASLALIADEAQDIDIEWFDRQFRPMAASTAAPVILFGTPWNGETLLDRAVALNRSRYPRRHEQRGWQTVAELSPSYGHYVRAERERLGPGSHIFRTQYELEVGQPDDALFPDARLAAILGDYPALAAPVAGQRYVAGLDVGGDRPGADASVLTIGRVIGARLEVVAHRAWQSAPFHAIAADMRALHKTWAFAGVDVDVTGMGAALATMLEEAPALPLRRFHFSAASKHELGVSLIAAAETGRLAIYADNGSSEYMACLHELRHCRAQQRPAGLISWGDPTGHDDYVASLALCLDAALAMPAPRVALGRGR